MVLTITAHLRKIRPHVKMEMIDGLAVFTTGYGVLYKGPIREAVRILLTGKEYLRWLRIYGAN